MLHAAFLRSPHAHASLPRIDAAPAPRRRRACAASLVAGEVDWLSDEVVVPGPARRCARRRHARAGARRAGADRRRSGRCWSRCWTRRKPSRRGSLIGEARRYERGDYERGLAEADVVVEAEYRTQTLNHNSLETHQCVCDWRGDGLDVYIVDAVHLGRAQRGRRAFGLPADKVRVVCEFMGGGFGSKGDAGDYAFIAAELARRIGRPVRYAMSRREENMVAGNRNATIQRVTAGARSDGTLTVLGGEYFCALGWSGWLPSTAGPMQLLHACENVRTVEYGAKLNSRRWPPSARPASSRARGRSSACSTSSRPSSTSTRSSCAVATTRTPTRWTAGRTRRRT